MVKRRKKVVRQSGKSNLRADRKRTAKKVGWRKSASGNWYFEKRANRSDKNRSRRL